MTILLGLSYWYKLWNVDRCFLVERGDITMARIRLLRKCTRKGGISHDRYLNQTWVNLKHLAWEDSDSKTALKIPGVKGSRLIVCHVGSITALGCKAFRINISMLKRDKGTTLTITIRK